MLFTCLLRSNPFHTHARLLPFHPSIHPLLRPGALLSSHVSTFKRLAACPLDLITVTGTVVAVNSTGKGGGSTAGCRSGR
ncbi:hypothetical protein U9M48_022261 [Paspalum notatum var. saurae]|uniref:Uncharacterized protein n=1 Tax=Paspalum notatum var. saurae TaxID=547442 RepID=A0AAQ3TLJ8_PASNO